MFDFAWSELALIAVVALVVIGPKDLPRVLRTVGQWVQRARAIAREFQGSLDQMVREAELDDMKRQFDKATNIDIEREINQAIDPGGELQRSLNDPVLANPLIEQQPSPAIEDKSTETAASEKTWPEDQSAANPTPSLIASDKTADADIKPPASEPETHRS
jgi:sec-independent protein translocase protein TatB